MEMGTPHLVEERDGFWISTDPDKLDVTAVHAYLSQSYWAGGISLELVAKSIAGSIPFGLFELDRQIGFARVITDRVTFAYLCDVYVLEEFRGRGLGRWLMEAVSAHPDLQNLRRFSLVTRDAHGLYEKFGFTPLKNPNGHMELLRPDIYKATPVNK